jgi:outer membrane protein OmpA-like peptidoglycan-associated protein
MILVLMAGCTRTMNLSRTFPESDATSVPEGPFPELVDISKLNCLLVPDKAYRDDTPLVTADGNTIYFNSTRIAGRPWARLNSDSTRYDDDIYYMQRADTRDSVERWSEPLNLGPSINTGDDDGVVSISPGGDVLYFCSLKQGFEKDGGPFYLTRRDGAAWGAIEGVGGGITQFFSHRDRGMKFLIYGASINAHGTAFYFATTLNSLSGEHQIWVSRRDNEDEEWQYPVNLGSGINAHGGSYAPFIAADDHTLYFASGRPGGFGGDDLYVSTIKSGIWNFPKNLGPTINTSGNDAFLSIPASGDRIYFTSGRGGICSAPLPKQFRPMSALLHTGLVTDRENGSPLRASLVLSDKTFRRNGVVKTRSTASGKFSMMFEVERTYMIAASVPGYLEDSSFYEIPADPSAKRFPPYIKLTKFRDADRNILTNVYFDYNSDTLNAEALPELERIMDLLRSNPKMLIEVQGYTDNIGSIVYNRKLSQRRAETVWHALVRADPKNTDRIRLRGFGSEQPRSSNDTEAGRQRNRRVEITLVNEDVQHAEKMGR